MIRAAKNGTLEEEVRGNTRGKQKQGGRKKGAVLVINGYRWQIDASLAGAGAVPTRTSRCRSPQSRWPGKVCGGAHRIGAGEWTRQRYAPPFRVRLSVGIILRIENVVTNINKGKI